MQIKKLEFNQFLFDSISIENKKIIQRNIAHLGARAVFVSGFYLRTVKTAMKLLTFTDFFEIQIHHSVVSKHSYFICTTIIHICGLKPQS